MKRQMHPDELSKGDRRSGERIVEICAKTVVLFDNHWHEKDSKGIPFPRTQPPTNPSRHPYAEKLYEMHPFVNGSVHLGIVRPIHFEELLRFVFSAWAGTHTGID